MRKKKSLSYPKQHIEYPPNNVYELIVMELPVLYKTFFCQYNDEFGVYFRFYQTKPLGKCKKFFNNLSKNDFDALKYFETTHFQLNAYRYKPKVDQKQINGIFIYKIVLLTNKMENS